MIYCSRFFVVLKIEEQRRMQLSVSFHRDVGPAGVQGFGLGAPGPQKVLFLHQGLPEIHRGSQSF